MSNNNTKTNTLLMFDQSYFEDDSKATTEQKHTLFPQYFGSYAMKIFVFPETNETYWYLSDLLKSLNNNSNRKSVLKRISEYVVNLIDDNNHEILNQMYQFDPSTDKWAKISFSNLHSSTQKSLKSDAFVVPSVHLLDCIQLIHSKMRINETQKLNNLRMSNSLCIIKI